ncbi:BspA family leucine-rich repeat surface protein [Prevotella copri]|uniref:BspA family leucine-rich repeat surface protein n=1 Tax=Segatella copri TaxID=165179 RepID=A0A646HF44_9BACT|nr:BspA family leucine-rich repeat surface protein [Segatella copri]MQN88597.1 BspA family leucine-rich repeat surface protein [Segatella copri]MQO77081.1 BspA family leucine-rich repeat surface protein [Segatella copri]
MNHFTNQSNGSYRGHSLMGRAMLRRFALFFPMILLMLLFLPARMVAQPKASSSKYIATFDSDTETLTFEKYEGESLPSDSESEWVEDGKSVFEMFGSSYLRDIKHIVINESFKTFTPTTLSCFFAALSELETITGLEYLNTANVTDMSFLFDHCQKLTSLDLSNFNTAKVTNMNKMFSNCSNLKTIYASDKFTTAAVTESKNMFSYCGSLSGDIDWTSDKATDKTYAKTGGGYFRDKAYDNRPYVKYADGTLTFRCGYKKTLGENEYALNSGENRPKWYTHSSKISKVVFEASFANARPTTCYAWFKNFTFLNQIEGIENLNTENVKDMREMFYDCSGLISLDVTHFNTENVTSMGSMFNSCRGLTSLDVTHFNTENVTSMNGMFNGCRGLISLDVTHFNTANVKNMSFMFSWCNKLKEIYVSDKFVTDDVIDSGYMFSYCGSLSGDIDWTSDKADDKTYAKTDGGYFRDKAYDNRPWVKYADGTLTFRCGYKKTLGENEYELNSGKNQPKWETNYNNISQVVFEASFANARPTNCYAWFQNFENLKQIEGIENLNTANVTDMSYMFKNCSNLAELDVTHFNTAKVTTMNGMFSGCSNLTELDLTHFNTENVTNMWLMFYDCESLTTIYVSDDFVITNITYKTYSLFYGCEKLKGAIDKYDNSKIDGTYANYKTGYFTKLVGKNGDEKIGAAGEPLATDNLVLDDGKDFVAYEPFTAKAASYSRPVKAGTTWATLCLPFEVSLADKNFRAFKLLSADEGTETVELEEIKTSIEAGTPVIIKMKDGATKLDFTEADKAIAKDVQTAETANGNYQLQGLYTQKEFSKDTDNNCYIVKGSKLMNPAKLLDKTATKSVGSKPFRAYMADNSSAPAAGARMFSISVGGSTTAIEQLETTADSKAEYYDLQGRRLQNLQKGVNIVKRGGKTMKVIIK